MRGQSELQIIKTKDIMINPENPRHNAVQMVMPEMGEELIMKELIRDKETANKMFDLIKSIFDSGFIPTFAVILEYKKDINKYIPWDGNRRITALKILENPRIMYSLKYFTYPQINTISEFSKKVEKDFFEVSAYIVKDFEEAAPMIKAIHTTASGGMQWDRIMIKRFEQKLGMKNVLTQAQELLPNAFKELPTNFPTTVLDKILESKEGKNFLNIDNIDNTLTFTSSMDDTEKKLKRIIEDIKSGNLNSKMVQSNKKIKEYLNNDQSTEAIREKPQKLAEIKDKTENILTKSKTDNELKEDNIINERQIELSDVMTQIITMPEVKIKKEKMIIFSNINIEKLDYNNERASGIKALAYEIQQMSMKNAYEYYPISYCFILRALFEQTSIYFLMMRNEWDEFKGNRNRDPNLGEIIKHITNKMDTLFSNDVTAKRCWENVFKTQSNKDYLDLVIHHPYNIYPNIGHIKRISDIGLFYIIQYFINYKNSEIG
ncbi:MAG: hypothetical protein HFJ54_05690 [Clostridia bacterium]|nr:hypothetical protein [Clostridia bacterium]